MISCIHSRGTKVSISTIYLLTAEIVIKVSNCHSLFASSDCSRVVRRLQSNKHHNASFTQSINQSLFVSGNKNPSFTQIQQQLVITQL